VGKNDLKNTEQGSATLEYLKTTDDEDWAFQLKNC
jgi:hypothetical protein